MNNHLIWATVAVTFGVLGFMAYAVHTMDGAEAFLTNEKILLFFGTLIGGGAYLWKRGQEKG